MLTDKAIERRLENSSEYVEYYKSLMRFSFKLVHRFNDFWKEVLDEYGLNQTPTLHQLLWNVYHSAVVDNLDKLFGYVLRGEVGVREKACYIAMVECGCTTLGGTFALLQLDESFAKRVGYVATQRIAHSNIDMLYVGRKCIEHRG